jgi:serine/threonine protein kinase
VTDSKPSKLTGSSGLRLRVRRANGSTTDLYIAEGLTIGRSEANTVCLPDDESIDRSHARVDQAANGTLYLRSQSATGPILERGQPVTELVLQPGRTFQIGAAQFECLSSLVETPTTTQHFDRCPDCGSVDVVQTGHLPRSCPDCGLSLLPIRSGEDKPVQFVPAEYGNYTAVRYVARGGMGLVLQGLTDDGRSQVAIKLLMSRGDNQDAVRRFRDEVQSLERIDHPHVVRVLGSGETCGFSYLVMEWNDGRSLREIIQTNREASRYCDAATATRWFHEVLQGLSAIHDASMIHRDIKPANILIASDGHARVSDLGLVKQLGDEATACTTTGMVPGTFEYMSPEQFSSSSPIDQRSDLYSLGVTFYELLTGERPHGVWVPPSQINPDVPATFDQVLSNLLSRDPATRAQCVINEIAATEVKADASGSQFSEVADSSGTIALATESTTPSAAPFPESTDKSSENSSEQQKFPLPLLLVILMGFIKTGNKVYIDYINDDFSWSGGNTHAFLVACGLAILALIARIF